MFRRNSGTKAKVAGTAMTVKDAVSDSAEAVVDYIDPLAKDEKLRERLIAALVAGAAARSRLRQQTGVRGLVRRLASDPVLRAQLLEMTSALQAAQKRTKKAHSHRRRNTILFLAGVGMTIAATPALREKATSIIRAQEDEPTPSTRNNDGAPATMGGAGLEPATPSL